MRPNERLAKVFSQVFEKNPADLTLQTDMDFIDAWDSLGHLNLIMAVEKEFHVKFPTGQIISLDSVEKIQNALQKMGAL